MDAVLRIDLEPVAAALVLEEFVDARGAIAPLGAGVHAQIALDRHLRIAQRCAAGSAEGRC